MAYRFFQNCHTAEDGKKLYRELARKHHPDNGGNAEMFKAMMAEFSTWFERHKDIHADDGSTAGSANADTGKRAKRSTESVHRFMDVINKIVSIPNLEIEICGTWLWLSGNTYPYRDTLKAAGFRWSKSKKRWYWTEEEFTGKYRARKTMAQIRMAYGSEYVEYEQRKALS